MNVSATGESGIHVVFVSWFVVLGGDILVEIFFVFGEGAVLDAFGCVF